MPSLNDLAESFSKEDKLQLEVEGKIELTLSTVSTSERFDADIKSNLKECLSSCGDLVYDMRSIQIQRHLDIPNIRMLEIPRTSNEVICERRLKDIQYLRALSKSIFKDRPIEESMSIIRSSLEKMLVSEAASETRSLSCLFMKSQPVDGKIFMEIIDDKRLNLLQVPSIIQYYYNSLVLQSPPEDQRLKRQRTEVEVKRIRHEKWVPLLGFITSEIAFNASAFETVQWEDLKQQALTVSDWENPLMVGIIAWVLNYLRHFHLNPEYKGKKLGGISMHCVMCDVINNLSNFKTLDCSIYLVYNAIFQSLFQLHQRLGANYTVQKDVGWQCHRFHLILMERNVFGDIRKNDFPINDQDEWMQLLICSVEAKIRARKHYEACIRIRRLQGAPFTDKDRHHDQLIRVWNGYVAYVYHNCRKELEDSFIPFPFTKLGKQIWDAYVEYMDNLPAENSIEDMDPNKHCESIQAVDMEGVEVIEIDDDEEEKNTNLVKHEAHSDSTNMTTNLRQTPENTTEILEETHRSERSRTTDEKSSVKFYLDEEMDKDHQTEAKDGQESDEKSEDPTFGQRVEDTKEEVEENNNVLVYGAEENTIEEKLEEATDDIEETGTNAGVDVYKSQEEKEEDVSTEEGEDGENTEQVDQDESNEEDEGAEGEEEEEEGEEEGEVEEEGEGEEEGESHESKEDSETQVSNDEAESLESKEDMRNHEINDQAESKISKEVENSIEIEDKVEPEGSELETPEKSLKDDDEETKSFETEAEVRKDDSDPMNANTEDKIGEEIENQQEDEEQEDEEQEDEEQEDEIDYNEEGKKKETKQVDDEDGVLMNEEKSISSENFKEMEKASGNNYVGAIGIETIEQKNTDESSSKGNENHEETKAVEGISLSNKEILHTSDKPTATGQPDLNLASKSEQIEVTAAEDGSIGEGAHPDDDKQSIADATQGHLDEKEDVSSVPPSFYEESDDTKRRETRNDDTHEDDADDETYDTRRTQNILVKGPTSVSAPSDTNVVPPPKPLTIQLKEEKAYEADIEMEDKKRRPLAVTFAEHIHSQLQTAPHDDEESKDKAYEADVEEKRRIKAGLPVAPSLVVLPPAPPSSSSSISSLHHIQQRRITPNTDIVESVHQRLQETVTSKKEAETPKKEVPRDENPESPPSINEAAKDVKLATSTVNIPTIKHEEEKAYEADSEMDVKDQQEILQSRLSAVNEDHDHSSFTDVSRRADTEEVDLHDTASIVSAKEESLQNESISPKQQQFNPDTVIEPAVEKSGDNEETSVKIVSENKAYIIDAKKDSLATADSEQVSKLLTQELDLLEWQKNSKTEDFIEVPNAEEKKVLDKVDSLEEQSPNVKEESAIEEKADENEKSQTQDTNVVVEEVKSISVKTEVLLQLETEVEEKAKSEEGKLMTPEPAKTNRSSLDSQSSLTQRSLRRSTRSSSHKSSVFEKESKDETIANILSSSKPKGKKERLSMDAQPKVKKERLSMDAQPKVKKERLSMDTQPKGKKERLSMDAQPKGKKERLSMDSQESTNLRRSTRKKLRPSLDSDASVSSTAEPIAAPTNDITTPTRRTKKRNTEVAITRSSKRLRKIKE